MSIFKKMTKWRAFLAGAVLVAVAAFFVRGTTDDPYFEISKNLDIYATLFKELNTYYVDPIEPGKLVKTGVTAMLADLDPYTNYITESDIEEYEFMTTGKYGGIGASMRKKGEDIFIGDVYENSPSQKAGLHPGDMIISVDGQAIKGKTIDDLGLLLKGSPGTQIKMVVKDAYKQTESEKLITRGEIDVSSVPYYALIGPGKDIALVKLTQFTQGCGHQVRDAFDSLHRLNPNLKGLILDLRNNPGGLLDEAVAVCNIFVDKGQLVVSTKGKIPEMDKEYKTLGPVWNKDLPLTVLVNHSSASASEIVSGTVQDLDRGVIIGERSYGKGLVQVVRPLGYNARLKITISRYYTPSGRCIQALDYAHRNADGSVGYIPDSLKKAYRTRDGRVVLSGGGIEPDIHLKDEPVSLIATTLYNKNYFFDYATDYASKHPTIADPEQFKLTDDEYKQFTRWLESKNYAYTTESEDGLDSLQKTAIKENYYEGAKDEFAALRNRLTKDKGRDLEKHREQVKEMLENEIANRYYYSRGRIAQGLQYDKEVAQAIEVITNNSEYQTTLKAKN